MKSPSLSLTLSLVLVTLGLDARSAPRDRTFDPSRPVASNGDPFFDELELTLESNVNDVDGEVVLHAETGLPIQKIALVSPTGKVLKMLDASSSGVGLSELRLETGEPTVDEIVAAYPEGTYVVRALTLDGEIGTGTVELSHDLPARFDIQAPAPDAVVPLGDVLVDWTHDPGTERYTLEIEDADDEQRLVLSPRDGASEATIPAALLTRGAEYQVVLVAHLANGNRLVQERFFRVE